MKAFTLALLLAPFCVSAMQTDCVVPEIAISGTYPMLRSGATLGQMLPSFVVSGNDLVVEGSSWRLVRQALASANRCVIIDLLAKTIRYGDYEPPAPVPLPVPVAPVARPSEQRPPRDSPSREGFVAAGNAASVTTDVEINTLSSVTVAPLAFNSLAGEKWSVLLKRWSAIAGVNLVWNLSIDGTMLSDNEYGSEFLVGAASVLNGVDAASKRAGLGGIRVRFFKSNNTLVIERR